MFFFETNKLFNLFVNNFFRSDDFPKNFKINIFCILLCNKSNLFQLLNVFLLTYITFNLWKDFFYKPKKLIQNIRKLKFSSSLSCVTQTLEKWYFVFSSSLLYSWKMTSQQESVINLKNSRNNLWEYSVEQHERYWLFIKYLDK